MKNKVFYSLYVFYKINPRDDEFIQKMDDADDLITRAARGVEEGSGYGGERDISFSFKTLPGVTNASKRIRKLRIGGKKPRIEIHKRDTKTYDILKSWTE